MNETEKELCAEAYHLQTNFFFQTVQFFSVVLSTTGIILILYVSINMFIKKIFHINLRILLTNLLVLLLLRSFVAVFRSSNFIYRMITYKDQCSFLENSIRCSILSISESAPLKCLRYAFIAITIERFIAMCFYHRYQKWKYPIALAFIPLTWVQLALSIKNIAVLVLYESRKTNISYCSSVTMNPVNYINLILEIPLLTCIFFLLLITRIISKRKMILQMRVSMDSLSTRYQIRENMKTSKTMFIATIMFIITSLLNLSGIFFLTHFFSADLLYFAISKEIVSLLLAIFINAISILLVARGERMYDEFIKSLLPFWCCPSNRVGVESLSGKRQMEIIEKMWEKEVRK